MRGFFVSVWLFFATTVFVACLCAQPAEPVHVPVQLKIRGGYDPNIAGTYHGAKLAYPRASRIKASLAGWSDQYSMPGGSFSSTAGTIDDFYNYRVPTQVEFIDLELGVEYSLSIARTYDGWVKSFVITPPPGYQILIGGRVSKAKTVEAASGTFKIRVLPALEGQAAPAGAAIGFQAGQVKWAVSLGAEKNGDHLGYAWIIGAGTGAGTDAWSQFLSPANLYCDKDKDSDDLVIYRAGGLIRQIRANEAWIDVISAGAASLPASVPPVEPAASGTVAYEIRFYHPSSMEGGANPRTPKADRQPFVVYRVIDESDGSTKSLRIEKQVCSLENSATRQVVRTENTIISRSGTSDTDFVWRATAWTLAGQEPVAEAVSTWSALPDGHRERADIRPFGGVPGPALPVSTVEHAAPANGLPRMVTRSVAGPAEADDSMESRHRYYVDMDENGLPDPAKRYRFGFPQLTTSGASAAEGSELNGGWSAISYIDPATRSSIPAADKDKWVGAVAATFAPFKDTAPPALDVNGEPAPGEGILATYYDYAKDAFGYPSRVTLTETYLGAKIPANLVAKSTISYAAVVVNEHDAIKATRIDYSASGRAVESSRIYCKENEYYSFLRDQLYAETSPAGARVSYTRKRGTFTIPSVVSDGVSVPNDAAPYGFSSNSTSNPHARIGIITGASAAGPDTERASLGSDAGVDIVNVFLIPGRSTRTYQYRDANARLVRIETYLRTHSSTWELIGWANFYYNNRNQLTKKTDSTGSVHELWYNFAMSGTDLAYSANGPEGEYLTREIDAAGVETRYVYDKAGRLSRRTRVATRLPGDDTDRPDLVTAFTYDAAGRVTEERTYAATEPQKAFVTTRSYDTAGRLLTEKTSGSPEIRTTYSPATLSVTVRNTGTNATRVTTTYRDGQTRRVEVNGVQAQAFDYGFESDGRRRSEVTTELKQGEQFVATARKTTSWTDWLGRGVRSEAPAPPGVAGPLAMTTLYGPELAPATVNGSGVMTAPAKERGLPIQVLTPGSTASAFAAHDSLGQTNLQGLDADLSGALDPASTKDRITGTRLGAIFAEGAWWSTSESYTYAAAGSAAETVLAKSWTRLSGWTDGLIAESRSWDAEGNLSRRTVTRDRAERRLVTKTWAPGLAAPAIEESVDGLLVATTSPDLLKTETFYDNLRRPMKTRAPQIGASGVRETLTAYKDEGAEATGLVDHVEDAEGRITRYSYDVAYRLLKTTRPDDTTIEQRYDDFGRVTHLFGSGANPVRYVYNAFGERVEQHTFRDTAKTAYLETSDFPGATDAKTDVVKWKYDEASGVLLEKTDPLGRLVKYDYDAAGRIARRYWARHKNPAATAPPANDEERLAATPEYDPATGDLLSTSYNDEGRTPAVSITYDRLGRPLTVTDAAGTRSFLRDPQKAWRTIAELLPAHYGSGRSLTWLYEEQGATPGLDPFGSAVPSLATMAATPGLVRGRTRGFQFGTLAQPASFLEHTTAYDAAGRLRTVTAARDSSGVRQNFSYAYAPGSRLLDTLSAPGTTFSLTRTWDPLCGQLDKIETRSGTRVFAAYEYTHNALGQRETVIQGGEAFRAGDGDIDLRTTSYRYDNRGGLSSAVTTVGGQEIPGQRFGFAYDLAGNRVGSDHQAVWNTSVSSPAIPSAVGFTPTSTSVAYTVGPGNRLLQRDNPNAVSVSGIASRTATAIAADNISILKQVEPPTGPVAYAVDKRVGLHWQTDLSVAEGKKPASGDVPDSAPVTVEDGGAGIGDAARLNDAVEYPRVGRQITTVAGIKGTGGAADLAAFDRVNLWLAPRDEQLRYDRDGNLLRDGTWAYTWDAENRLIKMENHPWLLGRTHHRLTFKYDYQGRRVSKTVETKQPTEVNYGVPTETRYLYDGWNLIAELQVSGSSSPPSLIRSYAWGLDIAGSLTASGGVGALLQITDHSDGQSYFPGYDGNGNVGVLVRASDGYRAAAYEYGPFGEILRAEGLYAAQNPFRFSSKFSDAETGLVYYGLRYYDGRNGRFINRDPIEERGGLNLYGFCGNDGVNRYDVLGMCDLCEGFKDVVKSVKKFFKKNKWAGVAVGAIASFFTYGAAAGAIFTTTAATATTAASTSGLLVGAVSSGAISAATATSVAVAGGGFAAGFVGGALSTGLAGGGLKESLKAGLMGGVAGGIGAYAGYQFVNWALVGGGGTSSIFSQKVAYGLASGGVTSAVDAVMGGRSIGSEFLNGALIGGAGGVVSGAWGTLSANAKFAAQFGAGATGVKAALAVKPVGALLGATIGGAAGYLLSDGNLGWSAGGALAGGVFGWVTSDVHVSLGTSRNGVGSG